MVSASMKARRVPVATYRLQFNRSFTFAQAADLVPYLAALGISHCYASPYLRARPGSTHGYDIIDHNSLNPEIGTVEDYERFAAALHHHGMGQILDIVPNHMGVMGSDNTWWLDVLENGESSVFADFFDIDWEPLKDELQGKVLVPVLGDQYGAILDRGELKLTFEKEAGEFSIFYHQHRFPVNPREYPRVLGYGVDRLQSLLGAGNADLLEFQSLISAFSHLPTRKETAPELRDERQRDKEINKRRLAALCARSQEVMSFIDENTCSINGVAGNSPSFEQLHELIKAQAYRLAYWRVAADDINYRRFFDVNDLAALRQENDAVFAATHSYILQLLKDKKIDGVRVDHPDGLYDPAEYFRHLQAAAASQNNGSDTQPAYVLAEKILGDNERLPKDWPIGGTTGYEFANLVNGLFVDSSSEYRMDRIYYSFVREDVDFNEIVYASKKTVMHGALTSELNVLASKLSRIALANRHTCDFTLNSLREALSEVAACFPVYRTYVTTRQVSDSDRKHIAEAADCAKRRSTAGDTTVFDFIREVLLTRQGEGRSDAYRRSIVDFAMKFQQFTSAMMAKGLEDTSFYRYHRLTSLNEVGGNPRRFGVSVEEFHHSNIERLKNWPSTMLATSTHDTKRSEDVRCRIDVLSEIPLLWRKQVRHWRDLNAGKKRCTEGMDAPSRNDEYLLYQTLVGTWPLSEAQPTEEFCSRIQEYMLKAIREAKQRTSWANQNSAYEEAVSAFVAAVLSRSGENQFLPNFLPFQQQVARFGMLNSLSQTLLKLTAPGVPDAYQGCEFWDFSLVDPDNRRPVNYDQRMAALHELQQQKHESGEQARGRASRLAQNMQDGCIKQYLIWKALAFRRENHALFEKGRYLPLAVEGSQSAHIVAFARQYRRRTVVVVVPRLCARLQGVDRGFPFEPGVWKDTKVILPEDSNSMTLTNVFTAEVVQSDSSNSLSVAALLANFPVTLLALPHAR